MGASVLVVLLGLTASLAIHNYRLSEPNSSLPVHDSQAVEPPNTPPIETTDSDSHVSAEDSSQQKAAKTSVLEPDAAPMRDWSDDTDPYNFYTNETLTAMAESGDGKAAELLSLRFFSTDPPAARSHAIQAAALDGTGNPLTTFVDHHLAEYSQTLEALPLMLVAKKMGNKDAARWLASHIDKGYVTQQQLHQATEEANTILLSIAAIRRDKLGTDMINPHVNR